MQMWLWEDDMTGKQDGYASIISGQFFWLHIPWDSAGVMFINRMCIISNKRPSAQYRLCAHVDWKVTLV